MKIVTFSKKRIPWNKEVPISEATRKKVSAALKGKTPWNKGKKFSLASRKKMSQSMQGREAHNKTELDEQRLTTFYKKGLGCNRLARIFGVQREVIKRRIAKLGLARTATETCTSPLFKQFMSEVRQQTLSENPRELERITKLMKRKDIVAARLEGRKASPTTIEQLVYNELEDKGVEFEKQVVINSRFMVDVHIPRQMVVIECDGDYWHNLPEVRTRDRQKDAYLTDLGYNVFHFWEHEIRRDVKECVSTVLKTL